MSDHERGVTALARGDYWRWRADVLRVIDGDTIEVRIDLGLGLVLQPMPNVYVTHVRLLGYDAPELGTDDGANAQGALVRLLWPTGGPLTVGPARIFVNSAALDGRGRILGTIDLLDGRSVIDEMVKLGWLRPYHGRGPRPWSS